MRKKLPNCFRLILYINHYRHFTAYMDQNLLIKANNKAFGNYTTNAEPERCGSFVNTLKCMFRYLQDEVNFESKSQPDEAKYLGDLLL